MKTHAPTLEEMIAILLVHGAGRRAVHGALRIAARHQCSLSELFGEPVERLLRMASPGEESAADALTRCSVKERERAAWMSGFAGDSGLRHCLIGQKNYPAFLGSALGLQAPPVIFYCGNEALLETTGAGIVGTRRPSMEGAGWARECAALFAEDAITVVSGGADGIDSEAHQTVVRADGNTIVILPEGLHGYVPPPHIRAGLDNGQVLLFSEFLPTDVWKTHRAMTRNRSIAPSASVLCVIEPRAKGGSMFTAEQGLAQDKPVFYWGGACRDGALAGQPNAFPLLQSNRLKREALRAAANRRPSQAHQQTDLFDN